jgi:hypothetical protein
MGQEFGDRDGPGHGGVEDAFAPTVVDDGDTDGDHWWIPPGG